MPQVINTNVMSLNAQRNLTTSGTAMATAIQRLSSGLRINSAKDDAAGLAISDRMTTQISGLNQAVRNANDGISLSQTTEGALQEVTNNLQRIRELSVQAANATNSASDLQALDQEVQQRIQEINRIASQTSFNGKKVLDGTFGNAVFQVGADVGQTISVGFDTSMKTSAIGKVATASTGSLNSLFSNGSGLTLATGGLTVNGTNVAAGNYADATSLAAAINTAYTASGGTGTLAAVSGNEIAFTNTSTTTAVTFGGAAATTLGVSTVAAATTGGATSGTSTSTGVNAAVTAGGGTVNGTSTSTGVNAAVTAGGTPTPGAASSSGLTAALAAAGGNTPGTLLSTSAVSAIAGGLTTLSSGDLTIDLDGAGGSAALDITGAIANVGDLVTAINTAAGSTIASTGAGGELLLTNATGTAFDIAGNQAGALGLGTTVAAQTTVPAGYVISAGDLTINGTDVAAGNYTTAAALATAIDAAWVSSGGTGSIATANGTEIDFSNTTGTAITIGGTDNQTGLTTVAAQTTVGGGFTLAANALLVDGTAVAAGTYNDAATLVAAINTAYTTSGGTGTLAAVNGNEITFTNADAVNVVNFTGAAATTLGLTDVAAATTGGGGFTLAANALLVDGTAVAAGTYNDAASLVAAINTAYTTSGGTGTLAAVNGNEITFTNADAVNVVNFTGAAATTLGLTDVAAATGGTPTNGTATSTGVNAAVTATGTPTPQTFAAGEFTVQIGTAAAIDLAGTYNTAQDLADAINSKVAGAFASVDQAGALKISAGDTVTLGGAKAAAGTGNLGFTSLTNAVSGDLNSANVLSTAGANDTILRVDAALTSVSTLRSTLGAIQNRFQSTINSLSAVSENLSASRSRILDTDFAAETAAMTRAQILQQAGTAMVAQANSAPQNVLSLLR